MLTKISIFLNSFHTCALGKIQVYYHILKLKTNSFKGNKRETQWKTLPSKLKQNAYELIKHVYIHIQVDAKYSKKYLVKGISLKLKSTIFQGNLFEMIRK